MIKISFYFPVFGTIGNVLSGIVIDSEIDEIEHNGVDADRARCNRNRRLWVDMFRVYLMKIHDIGFQDHFQYKLQIYKG